MNGFVVRNCFEFIQTLFYAYFLMDSDFQLAQIAGFFLERR